MNQEDYRKLISGRSRGVGAVLLRFFLYVASLFYQLAVGLRNLLYSMGLLKVRQVDAVVISVGNITAGGTGKTPLVIWLCKYLQEEKIPCAILTRGYKARQDSQEQVDEPAVLAESCPQARVIVNPDRVAGANEAVKKFGAKVLIMDDGFQHRRLGRELDIVTIDAMLPFGYGRLLPAGLLREPVGSLKRADAVIITRCYQVTESELAGIEEKIRKIKPDMIIARSEHRPVCAKTRDNKKISIEELEGKRIFAFCGIGNPEAFIETVKGLGINLAGVKIYDDHYRYANKDIEDICREAKERQAELILATQKDLSKIVGDYQPVVPIAYLEIELKMVSREGSIIRLIKEALAGTIKGY